MTPHRQDLSSLRFQDNVLVRREHFGTLILLRDGRRFQVPNEYFGVLREIADEPRPRRASAPSLDDRGEALLNGLLDQGVLSRAVGPSRNVTVVDGEYISSDCLSFPRTVYWECTRRCNFACIHCYTDSGFSNHETDLQLDVVRRLIDEMAEKGVEFFSIGGGEPLMYRDLVPVVRYARSQGVSVEVTTNGTFATPPRIAELKEAGLEYVQLSLDGATKETFEQVRPRSKFELVVRNGRALARAFHLAVSTVAVRPNVHEIPDVIELAKEIGAEYYRVIPLMPVGRGVDETLGLSRSEMRELNEMMLEKSRTERDIVVQLNENVIVPTRKNIPWMPEEHYGCPAGRSTCGIDAYGNVYPCAYMHHPALKAGNITEASLGQIWRDASVMGEIRDIGKLEGACGSCSFLETCRGGCRAAAFLRHGSLAASDPLCTFG